jgi:hypothetical protein
MSSAQRATRRCRRARRLLLAPGADRSQRINPWSWLAGAGVGCRVGVRLFGQARKGAKLTLIRGPAGVACLGTE